MASAVSTTPGLLKRSALLENFTKMMANLSHNIVLNIRYLANSFTGLEFSVDDLKISAIFFLFLNKLKQELNFKLNMNQVIIEVHVRYDNKV